MGKKSMILLSTIFILISTFIVQKIREKNIENKITELYNISLKMVKDSSEDTKERARELEERYYRKLYGY